MWRLGHRDAVEAYNAGRRVGLRELVCSECGRSFRAQASAKVCSRRCKDRRYARLHPEAERARQARKYARRRARARRGEA